MRDPNKITDTDTITVITGDDHAIGRFIQVIDTRFRDTEHDIQGEGYVMEYDNTFGFTLNLIGLTKSDLPFSDAAIIKGCDAFIASLTTPPNPIEKPSKPSAVQLKLEFPTIPQQ